MFVIAAVLWLFTAGAEPQDFLGKTVTDVRVEIAGVPVVEAGVLELVETRVGEPLGMENVRGTIEHLVGIGRFEDVRVFASGTDQGVALRWQLIPVRKITKITVAGEHVLSAQDIRRAITDRFGATPSTSRTREMTVLLTDYYRERGFEQASVLPRVQSEDAEPEASELVLTIEAGRRVAVSNVTISGAILDPEIEIIRLLGLQQGRPFNQVALDARIASFEESLREHGYYQARVRESHVPASADGWSMNIAIAITAGPHVSVVFAGDPLPEGNRNQLVPVRSERTVDQDLLEDASLRIENALREQGYRTARAPYTREEKAGELVLTFTIARGPLHRIGSVETTGHVKLTAADLAPLLQIKPGEPFVEARAGLIAAAITELYRVRGFAQASVRPGIQVLPEAQAANVSYRPVAINFEIVEGPQTVISGVTFEGNTTIESPALQTQMALQAGKPFYRPQMSVDRNTIERAYRGQGFQSVAVNSQLAFTADQQQVALTWMVREGDQIKIDHVLINGNSSIDTSLIRRELTIHSGDPLSEEAMLESQQRLAALGLFRRVRISELPRTGSLARDVLVDVEESNTTTIDYGGGVEVGRIAANADDGSGATDQLDIGPRGFFAISRRNLWGKNRSVTLFGRVTLRREANDPEDPELTGAYGFNDYRGLFTFREPRAFGTTGDGQVTAFIEQGRRSSFSFNRRGVTTDYARRLGDFTITGRYTFDYTKLFDEQIAPKDQLPIDRLFPQVKLSKVFGGIIRDSRDDVLDPQKGAVIGLDGSVAARILGSEVGFVKTFAQGFIYRRLPGRRTVIAAGVRIGLAVGFAQDIPLPDEIARLNQGFGGQVPAGSDRAVDRAESAEDVFTTHIKDLPASERFFAGGDTTVRGFSLDRLGTDETLDSDGFPQGGNGMAIFNFETRAPYWKNLQFVWFIDGGNVFKLASDIRLPEMRVSSGVGFRYRSPIGPLRVDWGWKLSTRLQGTGGRERSNMWHISLGQAF